MRMTSGILLVALAMPFLSGCTTTKASRRGANETRMLLQSYKEEQAAQYKAINARYEAESGKLSEKIQTLMAQDAQQGLDFEALRIADKILEKWEIETKPSLLQETFLETVRSDFEKVRSLEAASDALNGRFNKSFQKLDARMDALQKIDANLKTLGEDPDARKRETEARRLLYRATATDASH